MDQTLGGMPPLSKPGSNQTGMGGQALPPYLQTRKPLPSVQNGSQTAPVMTPSSTGSPGEVVNRGTSSTPPLTPSQPPAATGMPAAAPTTPLPGATPPQAGGNDLAGTYNFFKSDLQNQAKQAKANAVSDASARGVYYGTPLTGSETDIDTQLQRGIGQLGAGMYGNEQQNQLTRLGLATNLIGSTPAMGMPDNSNVMASLGSIFGQNNAVSGARKAPITPAQARQQPTPGAGPLAPQG